MYVIRMVYMWCVVFVCACVCCVCSVCVWCVLCECGLCDARESRTTPAGSEALGAAAFRVGSTGCGVSGSAGLGLCVQPPVEGPRHPGVRTDVRTGPQARQEEPGLLRTRK